jgi:hypothetical protein
LAQFGNPSKETPMATPTTPDERHLERRNLAWFCIVLGAASSPWGPGVGAGLPLLPAARATRSGSDPQTRARAVLSDAKPSPRAILSNAQPCNALALTPTCINFCGGGLLACSNHICRRASLPVADYRCPHHRRGRCGYCRGRALRCHRSSFVGGLSGHGLCLCKFTATPGSVERNKIEQTPGKSAKDNAPQKPR